MLSAGTSRTIIRGRLRHLATMGILTLPAARAPFRKPGNTLGKSMSSSSLVGVRAQVIRNVIFSSSDLNHSRYDSLVVIGQKRLRQGLTFLSTLTWARSYDLASSGNTLMGGPSGVQNPFNLQTEYAPSQFNAPVTWSLAFSYGLPAGRGRLFLNSNKALDYALGGWQLNGVAVYRGGFPIAITQNQNLNGAFGYAGQRPNATGTSPETSGSLQQRLNSYISKDAFSTAAQFTFGNVARYIPMRGLAN